MGPSAPLPPPDGDRLADVRRLPRRRRLSLRQWPLGVALLTLAVALGIIATDHFRRGAVLMSAAVVLAFFLRLLLTDADAGMLAVRSKRVDLVVLALLSLGTSVFTFIVPAPN